jgi:hypothetical protein
MSMQNDLVYQLLAGSLCQGIDGMPVERERQHLLCAIYMYLWRDIKSG